MLGSQDILEYTSGCSQSTAIKSGVSMSPDSGKAAPSGVFNLKFSSEFSEGHIIRKIWLQSLFEVIMFMTNIKVNGLLDVVYDGLLMKWIT